MRAHDVRNLRVCEVCGALLDKQHIIIGYGNDLCAECALRRAGGLRAFMTMYPLSEWNKLPLNVVGVTGMRTLLAAIAKAKGLQRDAR